MWAGDEHLWIRRSAIISQVGAKKRFVAAHEGELSGLSKREAMKHLG